MGWAYSQEFTFLLRTIENHHLHYFTWLIAKSVTRHLTGCGKKLKLCGIWGANCAVKNDDCAGNCVGLHNVVTNRKGP